jgi:CHAT domain-containing protein/tetratricopeptide (TPR) repeat protein
VTSSDPEQFLAGLVQIRDSAQQRAYISDSEVAPTAELVEALSLRIRDTAWKDPVLAEALTESNLYLASIVDTPAVWAYATRSRAQILHTMRKCAEAQPHFERAVQLFSQAGLGTEVGRTMVTEMENLAYLSRYEEAIRLEAPARAALEKAGDTRYLALIEGSLGNLYFRLRRFADSLLHYDKALALSDNPASTAAISISRAHLLTEMNRFDEALETYEKNKKFCEQHGLSLWVDIADRGISSMHLMRGNYSAALQIIDQIRRKHEAANDTRRVALCDLDRSEIYLQLNLFEDASAVSERAFDLFQKLGNRYESGVALINRGIAEFKMMNDPDAEVAFARARQLFVEEGNETWTAGADLWLAQLLIRKQQFAEAGRLARHSAEVFEKQQVPVRAANARVLSAQSLQQMHDTASAIEDAQRALQELEGFHAPWVAYQAFNTLGRLKELEGETEEAEELYLRAISELEVLRGSIRLDELRMSFGKDKYQVYENLVSVKLNRDDLHSAFDFIERSKSRTLIDLMERNLETAWDAGAEESPRFVRIRKIREELNILYSRLAEVGTTARLATGDTATKEEIGSREQELVELLREAGSEKPGWATLQSMPSPTVADVQKLLDSDEVLVEYYSVGDRFKAFIIGKNTFNVVRDLCSISSTRVSLKGLNFQLSKFHLQTTYLKKHANSLLAASKHHLQNLYAHLIAPIAPLIEGKKKLVIVPHQVLHYVPFHALFDGEQYLIDKHDLSYAASASVLKICRTRKPSAQSGRDLILAAADALTPYINDEVEALRLLMPNADVFVGAEAGEDKLRKYAPTAGKIHIASHGVFRADNPMFSSLRLGDNWLNLFDIFNLKLGAEITTLSACETGMSAVWEGDELLGLARGFLYAGTPSLVVSLWMVNDKSTAQMMRRFYEGMNEGLSKASALRAAILEVKTDFPHPYYWAPFVLLGKS